MLPTRHFTIPNGAQVMLITGCESALPVKVTQRSMDLCQDCGSIQYWCETPALQEVLVCAKVIQYKQ